MEKAYEGNEDYIFVSYSRKDTDVVLPIIEALQRAGFRVWYDAGIELGSYWTKDLADHIDSCRCLIGFLSSASIASRWCQNEWDYPSHVRLQQREMYGIKTIVGACCAIAV